VAAHWLLKTEPSTYSWDDLVKQKRAVWDGVKNALALRNIRAMTKGDAVLVYHTGDEKSAVGIARVVSEPYPDPKAKDPALVVVDLEPDRALPRPVTLAEMRANRALAGFDLLRLPRLSVVPVSETHWKAILAAATEKRG
jgi:predicted RNA-binding protein with PUA-like domain